MSRNSKIAKNTLILYFRLILSLSISLYTIRIVLNALGIEDYGIFSVVGGVIALLSFLPSAMAAATQRYFSFALGSKDNKKLKVTFSVNFIIYCSIAFAAFILLETLGFWYISEQLRIPSERMESIKTLYHYSTLTFIASIITSPFVAIIIAHEDMIIFAFTSIIDAVMKLSVALLLFHLPGDKLELYGLLIFFSAILSTSIYAIICLRKYEECQFRILHWDKLLAEEIISYTWWALFGQLTTAIRVHAVTILLNQTFNPTVVAARAIANSLGNQANMFANNFNTSLYPPIVKTYAEGNKNEMFSLVFNGSRITFFLMWILALPIFIEMKSILTYWLKIPPTDTDLFARLILIEGLITSISLPLMTAARATGTMRFYELTLGTIQLCIFPATWIALQFWNIPWVVFLVAIVANCILFFVRLIIVRGLISMPMQPYMKKVIAPVLYVVMSSTICSISIRYLLPASLISTFIVITSSFATTSVCIYYLGLDLAWRTKFRNFLASKILHTK